MSDPHIEAQQFELARREIANTCRALAADGLVLGTAGNVSMRLPRTGAADGFAITATGAEFTTMEPRHVVLVDIDGRLLDGDLEPTSELGLHLGLYRSGDTGAIVHTHAPMATALSCVLDELPCIHYQMLTLGGSVPVASYETFGTEELVHSVLGAMEGRPAVLMANHGPFTIGRDARAAVKAAVMVEEVARTIHIARQLGEPQRLDDADIARLHDRYQNAYGQQVATSTTGEAR